MIQASKLNLNIVVMAFLLTIEASAQTTAEPTSNYTVNRLRLARTSSHHQLLASLAGNWSFTGKHVFPYPGAKPVVFGGRVVKKMMLDGRYLLSETTGGEKVKFPSSEVPIFYKEIWIEGYDNVKQKFVAITMHNEMDTGFNTSDGEYDSTAKAIVYSGRYTSHTHSDLPPGTVINFRNVVRFADADHFNYNIMESANGKELIKTTLEFSKVKNNYGK